MSQQFFDWPALGGTPELGPALERSAELHRERVRAALRERERFRREAPELLEEVRATAVGRAFGVRRVVEIHYAAGAPGLGIYPGREEGA